MKIAAIDLLPATIPLAQPYAVATYATDHVRMVRVCIRDESGEPGLGAATPEPEVNGETFERCVAALQTAGAALRGARWQHPDDLRTALDSCLPATPGARAALDMALHDQWARMAGRPLVDLLGRVHDAMPTSVTIGVSDVATTLARAQEHLAQGFPILKVKIGADLELDLERLVRLRERLGPAVTLLVDANVGYSLAQLRTFLTRTRALDLQLIEQPLPPAESLAQRELPAGDVDRLVADESLHHEADAATLAAPPRAFGRWNLKLMKCGGIGPARRIAARADQAGIGLMWGCMDESVIGIAGALHAAFACPNTQWLDLDGSFDLARDFATGGFAVRDGRLHTLDQPGLGVTAID